MKTLAASALSMVVLFVSLVLAQTAGTIPPTEPAIEQSAVPPASPLPSPILIPVTGVALTTTGEPRTGQIVLHLALYAAQEDPVPVWTEDQLITLGAGGVYQTWAGGTSVEGIPPRVFVGQDARWVGVTIDQDPEQPRTMLVATPYAARAASADALGLRAASAFVLSENLAQILEQWGFEPSKPPKSPKSPGGVEVMSLSTGDNTTPNGIAKYLDNTGTLGQAAGIFESNGYLGIGTAGPVVKLDVWHNSANAFTASETLTGATNAALAGLHVYNNNASDTGEAGIVLESDTSGAVQWGIYAAKTGASVGDLIFRTRTGSGTSGERVRIANSGNVGIGTASPLEAFHVKGDTNDIAIFEDDGTTQRWSINTDNSDFTIRDYTAGANYLTVLNASGNVGIGTTTPSQRLHVAGDALITGNVAVDGNIAAKYQDVAEWVDTPTTIEAGTVVIVDPARINNVIPASVAYDTRVAGAVSRQPGLVLGEATPNGTLVAQSGRVRIKVDAKYGAVKIGDLLVTSPTPGHAMLSKPIKVGGTRIHRPGTVLGKALEALANGEGDILVLLTLQ